MKLNCLVCYEAAAIFGSLTQSARKGSHEMFMYIYLQVGTDTFFGKVEPYPKPLGMEGVLECVSPKILTATIWLFILSLNL